jgi:hypothetical protein
MLAEDAEHLENLLLELENVSAEDIHVSNEVNLLLRFCSQS